LKILSDSQLIDSAKTTFEPSFKTFAIPSKVYFLPSLPLHDLNFNQILVAKVGNGKAVEDKSDASKIAQKGKKATSRGKIEKKKLLLRNVSSLLEIRY
jgi:hypothetical protein